MAKKSVASLKQKGGVKYVKVIRAIKNKDESGYAFKESIVTDDKVKEIFAKK